jgi:hypothetical protein
MRFRRILIAVDCSPIAAHAANVGIELATALGSEVAFIHAVDPSLGFAPETGVSRSALLALAEQDGKALLAGLRQRISLQPPPLEILQFGKPATLECKGDMRTALLISVSVLLPLVWGWAMHRLLMWLWPLNKPSSANQRTEAHGLDPFIDYQI